MARTKRPEGNVEELPSGRFRVRVSAGNDPVTGKPRYLREIVDTRAEARAARVRLRNQVNENRHPKSDLTVSQAIDKWLEVAQHESSTSERYEQVIRLYINPTLGKQNVGKIDAQMLEVLYSRLLRCRHLCSSNAARGHRCAPLAPNTVRKVHFVVRAALDNAMRWGYLGVNAAAMCRPPAFMAGDSDHPTAEEAAALLAEASRDEQWALLLWLTMTVGWRRGELCALRWSDVDMTRGVITIERAYWEREEKGTKTHQRRQVAIDEIAVRKMQEHRANCVAACDKLGVELEPASFVFSPAPDHRAPFLPRSISQRYRRLAVTVGLRSTRLHALRHFSATELIAARVDVRTVAGRLGHGSGGATTLKVYAGWSPDADRRAAEAISGLVPQPDPTKRRIRSAHEKLAAKLKAEIRQGILCPGDELPTMAQLAAANDVAPNTANRAVAILKAEGLVAVSRGQRAVVIGHSDAGSGI
jgi:integrase